MKNKLLILSLLLISASSNDIFPAEAKRGKRKAQEQKIAPSPLRAQPTHPAYYMVDPHGQLVLLHDSMPQAAQGAASAQIVPMAMHHRDPAAQAAYSGTPMIASGHAAREAVPTPAALHAATAITVQKFSPTKDNFFCAVEAGDIETVKQILDLGLIGINTPMPAKHYTALSIAACTGNVPLATLLLAEGAYLLGDPLNFSPLHLAAERGHVEMVKFLLSQGMPADGGEPTGIQPIHLAAQYGCQQGIEMIHALIAHGAQIGVVSKQGTTVLHHAVKTGQPEFVRCILELGIGTFKGHVMHKTIAPDKSIDIHQRDILGETALDKARKREHDHNTGITQERRDKFKTIVQLLIAYGATESQPAQAQSSI